MPIKLDISRLLSLHWSVILRCALVLLDSFRISGTDPIHLQDHSNDLFYSAPEVLDRSLGKE